MVGVLRSAGLLFFAFAGYARIATLADGRTALAMARHGDLPSWLAAVHPRFPVPHLAAFTQASAHRLHPRWLQVAGALGCAVLALTVPVTSLIAGALALVAGVLLRLWRLHGAGK